MLLDRNHRQELIEQLAAAEKDVNTSSTGVRASGNEALKSAFEVSHFLAVQRVQLIKRALVENEIDY